MLYIIYANTDSLIKKINNCKNDQKNLQHEKQENIFLADIQCQLFGNLDI